MSEDPLRILLLVGSCSQPSHTAANVLYMSRLLEERDVLANVWDLRAQPVPFHNPRFHHDPLSADHPVVRDLAQRAQAADGFVWATPVYHNSFSGLLKNGLDNLSIHQFRDKPVALISHGGARSGVQPCDQLRIVTRGLLAVAIPSQVVTIGDDFLRRDDHYALVDETVRLRFGRLAGELIRYAVMLGNMRHQEHDCFAQDEVRVLGVEIN